MATLSVSTTVNGGGVALVSNQSVTAPVVVLANAVLPAAASGSLSARTDQNTGTLTLASGHGIATGARVDVFWTDPTDGTQKCQHKCTAGTVSGTAVPIDLGVGDDLPPLNTAVTAQTPTPLEYALDESKLALFAVAGGAAGKVVVEKADGTVVFHRTLAANGAGYTWTSGGGSNPLSDTPAKAFLSNGSGVAVNTPSALAGLTQ